MPCGQSRKLHWTWTGPFTVVKCLSDAVYRIQDTLPKWKRSRIVVHFDRLKPCASNPESESEPIRRRESKDATITPKAHRVNLDVDIDDEEDADSANYQGDLDNPSDAIVEQNAELLEQGDNLTAQEPLPSLPTAE